MPENPESVSTVVLDEGAPKRLRTLAAWFDLPSVQARFPEWGGDDEVQRDLRRWADQMEATVSQLAESQRIAKGLAEGTVPMLTNDLVAIESQLAEARAEAGRLRRQLDYHVDQETRWKLMANDAAEEIEPLQRQLAEAERERDALREAAHVGIELDNHHNANLCPYCQAPLAEAREALRERRKALRECRGYLTLIEVHCPCGARPESLTTHPHVIGCPVDAALRKVETALAAAATDGAEG